MNLLDEVTSVLIAGVAGISLFIGVFFRLLVRVPATSLPEIRKFPHAAFSAFSLGCFLYFALFDLNWNLHGEWRPLLTFLQLAPVPFIAASFIVYLETLEGLKPRVPHVWVFVTAGALSALLVPAALSGTSISLYLLEGLNGPAAGWWSAWLVGLAVFSAYVLFVVFRPTPRPEQTAFRSRRNLRAVRGATVLMSVLAVVDVVVTADIPPTVWFGVFVVYVTSALMLAAEITGLNETNAELHAKVLLDPLTGAFSRAFADAEVNNCLERVKRTGERMWLAMVDLDEFKSINDNFGHAAGDEALRTVVDRLKARVRPTDRVTRIGGDEFLLILGGNAGAEAILQVANRLLEGLREAPLPFEGQTIPLHGSLGLAPLEWPALLPGVTGPSTAEAAALCLKRADDALYQSKRAGKDQVTLA